MTTKKGKSPHSIEPIVVVFGSERLASLWCQRNARNPRSVMLASNGGERLRGVTHVTTVRFPDEWWEPVTHPCGVRVREVEDLIKQIKKAGGEIIEVFEEA